MKVNNGSGLELTMFSVPHICEPLTISLCATTCEHLSQLELADSCHDNLTLDMDVLIGSDYYWDLVTGDIRCGESGPVAINTRLGWVLSSLPAGENHHKTQQ